MAGRACLSKPWNITPSGVTLAVRLTPKGGRDAIDGIDELSDGSLVCKARVRTAPENGEANAALISLMAKSLRVPAREIQLIAGETSRNKRLAIAGDPATLIAALERTMT